MNSIITIQAVIHPGNKPLVTWVLEKLYKVLNENNLPETFSECFSIADHFEFNQITVSLEEMEIYHSDEEGNILEDITITRDLAKDILRKLSKEIKKSLRDISINLNFNDDREDYELEFYYQ